MRYAILADIHANMAAFTAVLDDIEERGGVDGFRCLGDTVGYGPDPQECLDRLLELDPVGVAGNHDLAAIGRISTRDFNPLAAFTARWTKWHLKPAGTGYLQSLPQVIESGDFTLVHASPRELVWEYLTQTAIARENFTHFKTRYCLVGHSHLPLIFENDDSDNARSIDLPTDGRLELAEKRLIINPGSVGQPRDGDPRAAYAIYDEENRRFTFHRVAYDIGLTQSRMVACDLPENLITRLSYGR